MSAMVYTLFLWNGSGNYHYPFHLENVNLFCFGLWLSLKTCDNAFYPLLYVKPKMADYISAVFANVDFFYNYYYFFGKNIHKILWNYFKFFWTFLPKNRPTVHAQNRNTGLKWFHSCVESLGIALSLHFTVWVSHLLGWSSLLLDVHPFTMN